MQVVYTNIKRCVGRMSSPSIKTDTILFAKRKKAKGLGEPSLGGGCYSMYPIDYEYGLMIWWLNIELTTMAQKSYDPALGLSRHNWSNKEDRSQLHSRFYWGCLISVLR